MQFAEDAGPLAHNVRPNVYREINNFYTATVYEKGSEVIRMLKVLIGDEAFRSGMDLYFERCDGTATTIEVFLQCFAVASGRDLTQFARWYHQSGTPAVTAVAGYDETHGTLTLDLSQTCPPTPGQDKKDPFVIPVAFGMVSPDGANLSIESDDLDPEEAERGLIVLSQPSRRITLRGFKSRPVPSLLRGFSAPVKLETGTDMADLVTLVAHDEDSFNRWQATQSLAVDILVRSTKAIRAGEPPTFEPAFAEALGHIIAASGDDHAFAAQVLTLPGEQDLAREIGRDVDPDAIHQARDALRVDLGLALGEPLHALYRDLTDHGPYSPDAAAAGRRALRNVALDLYTAGDKLRGGDLALAQFDNATNMTDTIAALGVMMRVPGTARDEALAKFYEMFQADALVVDKWLALQAVQCDADVIEKIQGLMVHPAFSIKNPNRVRALIGSFAAGNPTRFNAADGSGFDFVADRVLEIDRMNAQVAARLLGSFRSWRSLESGRRARAQSALERVAGAAKLSPDVSDIVARSLA